jgi:hypothetical protein
MKWKYFITVMVALGCTALAAVLPVPVKASMNQVETVVRSGTYRIVSGDDGQRIVMDGFGYRMEPGKPMLPKKMILIALPPGARVHRVEAQGLGGTLFAEIHRIAPAPPIVPLVGVHHNRELIAAMRREWRESYNTAYTTDDAYPNEIAKITGRGSLRKYAYVSVSVCPFSYRPLSGRLTYYDAVRITVHFSVPSPGSDRAAEIGELVHDRVADRKASELFINYDQVKDLYHIEQPAAIQGETYDYIIITADDLTGAIASSDFVTWKTDLGYSVRIVLLTDPEIAGQPGADQAEQIRNFLRSYYGSWGIQYVLFVGDCATVPMRYCFPNPDDHSHNPGNYPNPGGSVPTDNYYADLSLPDDESWDSDGDGYLGEYLHDNPDFLAEVYVGRIPTSDTNRITYALDKLVGFEQDMGAWKDHALQPGTILFYENENYSGYPKIDGCTLLNKIETDLMSGWTVSRYSEQEGLDPSDFPWPAVNLAAWTNDWRTGQYGVVNWSGHGAPFGVVRTVWDWDDGDGVPESDMGEMSGPGLIDIGCTLDDDFPSIVFAVSCYVGFPESNGVGNLGIDLLTEPGFGAAAGIVSSTRPAWISADVIAYPGGAESICYEFNRYGIGENERLGEALFDAKYYCYQNYGWDHYAEHINQCNFNLYGDPSMLRSGITTAVRDWNVPQIPESALLLQNYPNPFNPTTVIRYDLPRAMHVRLCVYNVKGELVTTLVNEHMDAGPKEICWDAKDERGRAVASGIYFYHLTAGTFVQTRKMALFR